MVEENVCLFSRMYKNWLTFDWKMKIQILTVKLFIVNLVYLDFSKGKINNCISKQRYTVFQVYFYKFKKLSASSVANWKINKTLDCADIWIWMYKFIKWKMICKTLDVGSDFFGQSLLEGD